MAFNNRHIRKALENLLNIVELEQERDYVSTSELFDDLVDVFAARLGDVNLLPPGVASDYAGVHLGKSYEDNDFILMINAFNKQQKLDAFYALKILTDAKNLLCKMPNIRECVLDASSSCVIVGDLHGNFQDLFYLIYKYEIPGKKFKFVFNGDYVDRGAQQVQVLLTILFAFLLRPDQVFINRGNHEDIGMNVRSSFEPNFMSDTRRNYGKYGRAIFGAATNLFRYLPIATIVQHPNLRLFVTHGGISDQIDLDFVVHKLDRCKFLKVSNMKSDNSVDEKSKRQISDLLWSDPIRVKSDGRLLPKGTPDSTGCFFNRHRNLGSLFGSDVCEWFCATNGFDWLVRSHEVREKGFSQDQARCITVFSASFYCDGFNKGAVLKLSGDDTKFRFHKYKNETVKVEAADRVKATNGNYLIRQFKRLLQKKEEDLMRRFREEDVERTGAIGVDKWAEIVAGQLNDEVSKEDLVLLKDFLCECETSRNLVNYCTMFARKNKLTQRNEALVYLIDNLFDLMDADEDERISLNELRNAVEKINAKETTGSVISDEQLKEIFAELDLNRNGFIGRDEFRHAFLTDDEVGQTVHKKLEVDLNIQVN